MIDKDCLNMKGVTGLIVVTSGHKAHSISCRQNISGVSQLTSRGQKRLRHTHTHTFLYKAFNLVNRIVSQHCCVFVRVKAMIVDLHSQLGCSMGGTLITQLHPPITFVLLTQKTSPTQDGSVCIRNSLVSFFLQ